MIRAHRAPRPDAACHSADVLTPTERAADRAGKGFIAHSALVYRDGDRKWGDDPAIRDALQALRRRVTNAA